MIYLLLSIFCSVTVGVIFKISAKYVVNTTQIVSWNYVFAFLLSLMLFQPNLKSIDVSAPWYLYIILGILLPTIFLVLAASIKHIGIVKTDAAQRLSLFLPLIAAWLLFKEEFTHIKLLALLIALPALILILYKKADTKNTEWRFPILVFIGFGAIDILFKQLAQTTTIAFTSSLAIIFGISFCFMMLVVGYQNYKKKVKINIINLRVGGFVGLFNFGNILFYLKAHQAYASNPSTVFAAMNMGVILLGSIIGVLIFKEKLSSKNYLGLVFALAAILLISISQLNYDL
jgi:multidrug transporter EmrE-like cation transporter